MTIRLATLSDIPAIQHTANIAFRHTYRAILSPEQLDYMMDWMYSTDSLTHQITDPGKVFFLAKEEGDCIGYASCEPEGTTYDGRPLFHLQKLYLLPEQQGKGYGKALVEAVMSHVKESLPYPSHARIELNVNRRNTATAFYERMGMYRDRQGDFPIGHGYYMNDYIYAIDL